MGRHGSELGREIADHCSFAAPQIDGSHVDQARIVLAAEPSKTIN